MPHTSRPIGRLAPLILTVPIWEPAVLIGGAKGGGSTAARRMRVFVGVDWDEQGSHGGNSHKKQSQEQSIGTVTAAI